MDFFDAVKRRRSIRKFIPGHPVPDEVIEKALDAAIWAPNSSNAQTWDFYWVREPQKKQRLVLACLNQVAARTASELVVVTVNPKKWRRSYPLLNEWVERENAPKIVRTYYKRLIPHVYRWGFLNSFGLVKWIAMFFTGLFTPIIRTQNFRGQIQEVAVKSAALASENFVLAVAAQDYDTCMMEGFDQTRVRKILGLGWQDRVVMVIAVGKANGKGTWNNPFRIPKELVIHTV